jgi:hypothetical protein
MRSILVFAIALLISLPAGAQVRQKKSGPADFDQLLKTGGKAYHSGDYSACITSLKEAIALAAGKQQGSILDIMPPAPAGFTKQQSLAPENDPFAGAMASSVGSVISQEYTKDDGNGHISITITANSPMVGMIEAAFQMARFNSEMEVVKYNQHKALFQKGDGNSDMELQIPFFGKHFMEVTASGLDEDTFFATFNQKFIDALAQAMGE